MTFVHMQLGANEPVRVPDDPGVMAVFEARGFQQVDDPTAVGTADVADEVAEVDDRGIGWLHIVHDETNGTARIPNQPGVLADFREKGWRLAGEPSEADELETQTVAELKAELKERGLPTSGPKQELIDRLTEDDDQAPVEPDTKE
jgi:SAP domain